MLAKEFREENFTKFCRVVYVWTEFHLCTRIVDQFLAQKGIETLDYQPFSLNMILFNCFRNLKS